VTLTLWEINFSKQLFFEILIADSDSSQTVFLFEKFLREHCQKFKKPAETSVSLTYFSFSSFFSNFESVPVRIF